MSDHSNKTCDNCGIEIPDSADRKMSDVDTYWCDACENGGADQSAEALTQRLADRDALGVPEREDNPVWTATRDEGRS